MPRWHVQCDACDAQAWIGPSKGGRDAWCEACQRGERLRVGAKAGACAHCAAPLTTLEPGFEECFGELQNLDAVIAAWMGDPAPLGTLLPERPCYLTDLDPPAARPDDAPDSRAALEALAAGEFARARVRLEAEVGAGAAGAHLWGALAVAAERTHDPALAEAAWTRVLERGDDTRARLARGVLRARRGEFASAREDLKRAGETHEARWNRAALAVLEAVAVTPGLPDAAVLRAAREEAGTASPYWSDHTIGRLLWSALIERASARAQLDRSPCTDARVLRAAERELEFETFWDRALVVHGYAALGLTAESAAAAQPLALERAARLAAAPWLRGEAAGELARDLALAASAIAASEPAEARRALACLIARDDLRRYRIPCAACGRGSIGVDAVEDAALEGAVDEE